MITRQQFLACDRIDREKCLSIFRKYHGQFVNEKIKAVVEDRFGIDKLVKCYNKNEHFNSMSIEAWDRLVLVNANLVEVQKLKAAGEGWGLGIGVLIFKEAARQLVEQAQH